MWKITNWKKYMTNAKICMLQKALNFYCLGWAKGILQNIISEKYGLYPYKCQDSRYNLFASYIEECANLIKLIRYKVRYRISCHRINVSYFLSCNYRNRNETYTGKRVNSRHRMNNHVASCRYGNSTDKIVNHVFKCFSNEDALSFLTIYAFTTVNNKINCNFRNHSSFLHEMCFSTMK